MANNRKKGMIKREEVKTEGNKSLFPSLNRKIEPLRYYNMIYTSTCDPCALLATVAMTTPW